MQAPDHIEVEYIDAEEYLELIEVLNAAERQTTHGAGTQRANLSTGGEVEQTGFNGPLQVELEDVGFLSNRIAKFRKLGLKVTDISSSEWCQQQVAFSLSASLPKVPGSPFAALEQQFNCWFTT